jgi:hypothetical protein
VTAHFEANKDRYWEMFRSLRNAKEQERERICAVIRAALPATEADYLISRITKDVAS